jgi:hypothetical protein
VTFNFPVEALAPGDDGALDAVGGRVELVVVEFVVEADTATVRVGRVRAGPRCAARDVGAWWRGDVGGFRRTVFTVVISRGASGTNKRTSKNGTVQATRWLVGTLRRAMEIRG